GRGEPFGLPIMPISPVCAIPKREHAPAIPVLLDACHPAQTRLADEPAVKNGRDKSTQIIRRRDHGACPAEIFEINGLFHLPFVVEILIGGCFLTLETRMIAI